MSFTKLNAEHTEYLSSITGQSGTAVDADSLERYGQDETEDLMYLPEIVLKPANTKEVSAILKYCNEHSIPVTARGGGTGLSGAALPIMGGVLLSMEKFNKILEIDRENLQATVEPGVITEVFMDVVAAEGLLYPVDPSSKGSCLLGGNVAHGSGGPRVVKYGTIREYILNLEIVLASGEVLWTGANTLKYASGYNLTQLMIGSEGTLAVVTRIVTKLIPRPAHNVLMLGSFNKNEEACAAVSAIFRAGVVPSALEFMERQGVEWVVKYDDIRFEVKDGIEAYLMIEIDGNDLDDIFKNCEVVNGVLEQFNCKDVLFADSAQQKEEIWRMRRTMAESVKSNSVYKEEDTVVPRAALPQLIFGIKEIGSKFGFESICYGHAGDGNLHVNIIKGGMSDEDWKNRLKEGIEEIFRLTVALGGTISGEHGIGLVQKEFMHLKYDPVHIGLMRGIKEVFDPRGILNPGKIF